MNERFLRIYKKLDFPSVKSKLLIYGALSGSCANCKTMELKLDMSACPHCHAEFKFISFLNIKDHLPKMLRLSSERPDVIFIDYEDFKRTEGAVKAQEFLR